MPQSNSGDLENIRMQRRYGVSLKIGGPTWLSISFDAFITPEINAGIVFSPMFFSNYFGLGANVSYHFAGDKPELNWTPYAGIEYGFLHFYKRGSGTYNNIYFPIGVCYTGDKGLGANADVGYMRIYEKKSYEDKIIKKPAFIFSTSAGYRFNID